MRKILLVIFLILAGIIVWFFASEKRAKNYVNVFLNPEPEVDSSRLPAMNKALLNYAETYGKRIAPTYSQAVCTEYLIGVISNFKTLNAKEKRQIRIITDENLDSLLQKGSPIIKGVYTALKNSNKGIPVDQIDSVKAGDLIQFWDTFNGKTFGHCGIVRKIDQERGIINMYSSAPSTNGHGKQTWVISKYMYFVRLK